MKWILPRKACTRCIAGIFNIHSKNKRYHAFLFGCLIKYENTLSVYDSKTNHHLSSGISLVPIQFENNRQLLNSVTPLLNNLSLELQKHEYTAGSEDI